MSRTSRLVVPEYPHHVTQRGGRRQTTFFSDSDYKMYIDLMASEKESSDVEILAYCLMPNHVHHVIVPHRADSLSSLFRRVHGEYARRVNRREGWQGHLWQERFHSFVLDENYLLATVRYVELNPVRAGLCSRPDAWSWSSVHAHVHGEDDLLVAAQSMRRWIDDWPRYLGLGDSESDLERIRLHKSTGLPIGADAFIDGLEDQVGRCLRTQKRGPKPASPR